MGLGWGVMAENLNHAFLQVTWDRPAPQQWWNVIRYGVKASVCVFLFSAAIACDLARTGEVAPRDTSAQEVKQYRYQVMGKYPHDPQAFTQGLIYHGGYLYESTGLQEKSSLRKVELSTGKVLKKVDLDTKYFGEGLTIFRDRIYQLTWLSGVGFIYNLDFNKLGEFHYEGEGWGLTHNARSLILSDGTNRLKFLDPKDFKVERSIEVLDRGQPLNKLNELEFINGEIFSNVWHKDLIVRIDPGTGRLLGIIDLSGLGSGIALGPEDVLNGIAYLPKDDCLIVTGKRWPFLFKIRIITSGE
jgi:glutamine cyclotransferase